MFAVYGVGIIAIFILGTAAGLTLALLKWLFWPPVYSLGVPVFRRSLDPGTKAPAIGSIFASAHGVGRMVTPERMLFVGSKTTLRSPFALTATVEFTGDRPGVVARVPADAVVGMCLWMVWWATLALAAAAQDADFLLASIFLAIGGGFMVLGLVAYRVVYFQSRKRDVLWLIETLESQERDQQA